MDIKEPWLDIYKEQYIQDANFGNQMWVKCWLTLADWANQLGDFFFLGGGGGWGLWALSPFPQVAFAIWVLVLYWKIYNEKGKQLRGKKVAT